jgi:ADP-dependent NAD(P)H-hydrate dehydratase / NAD(P)H-hydrate epimerase
MDGMHVLSAAEMQACDRATTERYGVSSLELMRAAAAAVAAIARERFTGARRVTVLCGKGNNGGDGMMAARQLADAGLEVTTLLLGDPAELKGDAAEAWREYAGPAHGLVHSVNRPEDLARYARALDTDLIVDAVVGTGFKPPLKGSALAALEWMKGSRAPILAVDLPSGWAADSTEATVGTPVFPADAVVTFTAPKPAHVFVQLTRAGDQPIVVAPIGSPEGAIVSALGLDWAGAAMEMVQTPRAAGANKGNFGHVLVVGGSVGRSGAPAMTSLGALRAGAGLVTAAVPAAVLAQVAGVAPELMTFPLKATAAGQIAVTNLTAAILKGLTAGKTVLAMGPGLGQGAETARFVSGLLAGTKIPVVIDADGLNILAKTPALLAKLAKGRMVVLTPHPGEMARLVGMTVAEVQANRLEVARGFAVRTGVTLVLKGARTLIAHPDGRVAVNTTGNPGMAKGGSGDLLTGVIAGLLAQYPGDVARAVEAAVYLHGLAADMAVREMDEHTLLATDSLKHFSQAFRFESRGSNGYVWLQGHCMQQPFMRIGHE